MSQGWELRQERVCPSVLKPWLVLPFPSDSGIRCTSPGIKPGELCRSRLWCAGLSTSGTLNSPFSSGESPSSETLNFPSADSCSQGCWGCALIFHSRLEALAVFSLSLPPPLF